MSTYATQSWVTCQNYLTSVNISNLLPLSGGNMTGTIVFTNFNNNLAYRAVTVTFVFYTIQLLIGLVYPC